MSVHMIRVWAEPPKNSRHLEKMRQACEDWASTYDETLTTNRLSISHITPSGSDDTPEHSAGYWRFAWHEDAQQLLADLEAELQANTDWYRVRYHACSHDESESSRPNCSWDETREYGTIPAGI